MSKKLQIKKVLSTSVFKLIAIAIIAIVPLNILILSFSSMTIHEVENQISMEAENALKMYMNQMDGAMKRIMSKMRSISLDDVDFARMNNKEITDREEYYQQMQSSVRLMDDYHDILVEHELINGIFTIFPEKDINITQNTNVSYGRQMVEYVKDIALNTNDYTFFREWRPVEVDGHSVLLCIERYKNAYYGAWIDLNSFMNKMGPDRVNGIVNAFVDASGSMIYSDDAEFVLENIKELFKGSGNSEYMLLQAQSDNADISYIQLIARSEVMQQLPSIITLLQILSICTLAAVPIIIIALRKWMIIPLGQLSEAMDKVEQGNMDFRIVEISSGSEYEQINRHFNQMMDEVEELNDKILDEQLKKKDIQMQFLSQQIQPHFILNAMDIIYSYEPEEYPLIQKMILCLSRYFRYVVNAGKDFVELSQEMEHINNYLDIQHERYPDVFYSNVEYEPEIADCLVPPLLIQSFAENAIKHSINIDNKIDIFIVGQKTDDHRVRIRLLDTGDGISDVTLQKIEDFRRTRTYQEGLGIGIQNAIERLELKYGENSELNISRIEPHGTQIEIIIPLIRKGDIANEGYIG